MKRISFFKRKINNAVVLLGGGARGLAHIGFLQSLKENKIKIDLICGTSMGGIVGGLYAYGYEPEKLEEMVMNFDYKSFMSGLKIPLNVKIKSIFELLILTSYSKLTKKDEEDKIENVLKSLTNETNIENLKTKFFCVAADLLSGKEVIFDKGPLYKALRATMSYPFVFEPVYYNKMLLVDGGFLDNAPVLVARDYGAQKILAVDIHIPIKRESKDKLQNDFNKLKRIFAMTTEKLLEINLSKADYVLKIDVQRDTFDFSEPSEIIKIGKDKTDEKISEIKKILT
ncbi:MAG TPA: patatin-like phospholipase family protein [Caldisericia bacterium]|nr:patatin-like phospholipase family protein [Caldisericia bacterium]HPB33292.1 patatin-like phospholipase family protein [Caldisericia bacterium]HQL66461.1 patatin-like phospholipase family protein [Caldisericia bacterium]HQN48208.1 patatin-like phospholipase family protein [Caldisericia bacterium]HQO99247.1 patatin-like phospholipase family protein [Caldisericia bacterium]